MSSKRNIKRGEIYYYDFGCKEGSVQNGCRPVLIVQCDEGNQASDTTIVATITSGRKRYLPTHIYLDESCGLTKPSLVLTEQLRTIRTSDLQNYVGAITDEHLMKVINRGLKTALGMWSFQARPTDDVRCLCSKCLEEYLNTSMYTIRKVNPYSQERNTCGKCHRTGYEYILTPKRSSKMKGANHNV